MEDSQWIPHVTGRIPVGLNGGDIIEVVYTLDVVSRPSEARGFKWAVVKAYRLTEGKLK